MAAVVVPIVFGILGGFKDNGQLFTNPFGLPAPWRPGNYLDALGSSAFWRQATNSLTIAVASTVLVVLIGAMAAYIFARYAFRGRELLFTPFTAVYNMAGVPAASLPLHWTEPTSDAPTLPVGVMLAGIDPSAGALPAWVLSGGC